MSASLVGSEMCIRDSSTPLPLLTLPSRRTLPCAASAAARTCPEGLPPSSVSYTHLTLPTICSV
eukprot:13635355-Alexandrium_andersonii.AAC.1